MLTFEIPVRNETTGEMQIVEVLSAHPCDAQIQALHRQFHEQGWRNAIALRPQEPVCAN